ncbi:MULTISPECIES: phage recombination protein Bet [unclassified Campylobacter]|uniref:phage recombination protein Bet n=1 Tax=unclassified Campylobacter TaxID=2593542 RepID=UPI0022E9C3DA|nr:MULTISPECIES: phage recombination protein Bet [unclassified Campylobacter]MDA3056460.1 phage recombination protein Bet [Campylobacter sp. CN_NA1]MDA3069391.1 phage recombination protein Bet [Campylobacter sp. CN_NE3]
MSNNLEVTTERADLIVFTDEEKRIIRNQFFPAGVNVSDNDMIYCMRVAKTFGLNPILKQIYFVERKTLVDKQWITKVEPVAGRDSFLTLAHRSGKFAGIESEAVIKEKPFYNGTEWQIRKELVAIAKVYRTDTERPFVVEVSYSEYAQKTRQGEITKFWREMPETMLKKVAESQCLRKAFNISGLYSIDERGDNESEIQTANLTRKGENLDLNKIAAGQIQNKPQQPQPQEAEIIDEVTYEPYYDDTPNLPPQPEPKPQQTYKAEPKEQVKSQPTQPNHETKEILKQILMQKGLNEYEAIDFMAKNAYTPVLAKQFLDDDKKLEIKLAEFFGSEINL